MYSTQLSRIPLFLALMILSSCSLIKPKPIPVEIKTVEVKIPIEHPLPPRPIRLGDPNFYVVSPANREEFDERIEKESQSTFFALSVADYELMAANMQEIKRYINQLKEIIIFYRKLDDEEEKTEEEPL